MMTKNEKIEKEVERKEKALAVLRNGFIIFFITLIPQIMFAIPTIEQFYTAFLSSALAMLLKFASIYNIKIDKKGEVKTLLF